MIENYTQEAGLKYERYGMSSDLQYFAEFMEEQGHCVHGAVDKEQDTEKIW